jgi:hypothetical protein
MRVYETLSDPTGREVCGYLLVRGSVHAHSYALAIEKLTGVDIKKMLPTPNIPLGNIPECQKYLDEGSHRRLYTWSNTEYQEISGIWGNGEVALPDDPPGELEVVEGMPEGGKCSSSSVCRLPSRQTTLRKKCSKSRASSIKPRAERWIDRRHAAGGLPRTMGRLRALMLGQSTRKRVSRCCPAACALGPFQPELLRSKRHHSTYRKTRCDGAPHIIRGAVLETYETGGPTACLTPRREMHLERGARLSLSQQAGHFLSICRFVDSWQAVLGFIDRDPCGISGPLIEFGGGNRRADRRIM